MIDVPCALISKYSEEFFYPVFYYTHAIYAEIAPFRAIVPHNDCRLWMHHLSIGSIDHIKSLAETEPSKMLLLPLVKREFELETRDDLFIEFAYEIIAPDEVLVFTRCVVACEDRQDMLMKRLQLFDHFHR